MNSRTLLAAGAAAIALAAAIPALVLAQQTIPLPPPSQIQEPPPSPPSGTPPQGQMGPGGMGQPQMPPGQMGPGMMGQPQMPQGQMAPGSMDHGTMGGMQPATPSTGAAAPSAATKGLQAANAKMHRAMNIRYTGNPDRDFVTGMIPHHQGAIDMARVVLQYGKDPEVKKLALDIIAAQQKEIAFMREWQRKQAAAR